MAATGALNLIKQRREGVLAHAERHVYLNDGAACILLRGDEQQAAGRDGPLPERVLPLTLRVGDRLLLIPADRVVEPARINDQGQVERPASICCTLAAVFDAAAQGQRVWFEDGRIGGRILAVSRRKITGETTQPAPEGSRLRPEQGINLPDTRLDIPALTPKDLEGLRAPGRAGRHRRTILRAQPGGRAVSAGRSACSRRGQHGHGTQDRQPAGLRECRSRTPPSAYAPSV